MSEQILKALMQLFAIIARPDSNRKDRRTVVELFLLRMLNKELVQEYLQVFDKYYQVHQELSKEKKRLKSLISFSSVRVLKICTQINDELTQQQKIIVVFQLLEFVRADSEEITRQEMEFIEMVAETFYIATEDFNNIRDLVLLPESEIPATGNVLIINNQPTFSIEKVRHIYAEGLSGQIRVLFVSTANMYLLRYLGSAEMNLNGQMLQPGRVYVFNTGSSVRNTQIKPVYYSDVVTSFNEEYHKSKIVFEATDINYKFKNGKFGLKKMSFREESGKLVGIMGASGAGKSTLLNVLNGTHAPHQGNVLINGVNIHNEKEKIEGLIGHVSQDDLLIEELTVFENLYFNAKLCFDHYSKAQLKEIVDSTLKSLGLYSSRDIMVGSPLNKKISGGQRKRLNIALELIREPSILFLDEPTSGLSSRDSENIMDLLKELSLKGKLVIVVIHQPSSNIFKMFDKLMILDTGGYLIYYGDPIESIIYFKSKIHRANWSESECHICGNVNPEQIFNIVELHVLDEYGKITPTRKISPLEWNQHYSEHTHEHIEIQELSQELPEISFQVPVWFRQVGVFIQRDILSKLSNTQYLFINFLEAPVLAFILSYIIKFYNVNVTNEYGYTLLENSNLPVYLFMSVIVAIFVGLTVSAEEIIKDRKILKRESFLNLSWSGYLVAKIGVLFFISAIQALSFVLIGNSILEIEGMYFHFWIVLFSAWASANLMGLVISDSFKTVVTIYILIPFLVIPQIILSGIIVKYEKLNPSISSPSEIPIFGEFITARWGYEALAVYHFTENEYDRQLYSFNKAMSQAEFKKNYWVPDLRNKIDFIRRHYQDSTRHEEIKNKLILLRNELGKEVSQHEYSDYMYLSSLYPEKLTEEVINGTRNFIELLSKVYIKAYNKVNQERDIKVSSLQAGPEMREAFLDKKRRHHNDRLEEFVTNSDEPERIVEYKNQLYQKIDPIYLDPAPRLLKSHFYAPRKYAFNTYISTYWVNVAVIWLMTLLMYILLYFRVLPRILAFGEGIMLKLKKTEKE